MPLLKKCPCEECITLAICLNQKRVNCSLLYKYLDMSGRIKNCYVLSIHNAHLFFMFTPSNSIEFIKDKEEAKSIIHDKFIRSKPISIKVPHYMRYFLLNRLISGFRIMRYMKNKLKLVYRWDME